jgi:hypothetical protein
MRIALGTLVTLALSVSLAAGAPRPIRSGRPGVAAFFTRRSYAPGDRARIEVWGPKPRQVELFAVGTSSGYSRAPDELAGVPVTRAISVSPRTGGAEITVRIEDWPSGLYFARLTAASGRVGYATFVVRPRRLGQTRVAVVLPTDTWQAYNFRDVNGDGVGDTWYADPQRTTVDLERPFLDRGVPPHFKGYDVGFLVWLAATGRHPEFLTDDDLEHLSGDRLARLYDLIVFPGHTEYVTTSEYEAVARFRDLGGNLAFLSANNFFYRVERQGETIIRSGRWRDLGRPESRLIGAQYVDWNHDTYRNRPFVVTGVGRAPWLFRGTRLRNGDRFGVYGIEVDARTSFSPPDVRVLARIPDIFGPGESAEMTYYTTSRGAKVFDAGVINFGGTAREQPVATLLDNLWVRLSSP